MVDVETKEVKSVATFVASRCDCDQVNLARQVLLQRDRRNNIVENVTSPVSEISSQVAYVISKRKNASLKEPLLFKS